MKISATLACALLVACSKDRPVPIAPASKIVSTIDAPQAPTNLRIEALTDTSAKVAWDAVGGATDYDLNYRTLSGRWTNEPHKGTRLWNTIYDLEPNTEYRWAIRAENRDGPSDWVFGENFTTLSAPAEPFNIDLRWTGEITYPAPFIAAVERAAEKWESIIINGVEDSNRNHLPSNLPDIDDLLIDILLNDKPGADQEGNVYGAATVDLRRTSDHYTTDVGVPIYGSIYLPDKPEYREGYRNNEYVKYFTDQLNYLAIHEIGHVLGLVYSFEAHGFRAYGPKALEVWHRHVPRSYHKGRDWVPTQSGHWANQYRSLAEGFDKMWIYTNSTMATFRLSFFEMCGHYRAYDSPGGDTYYHDKMITELDAAALNDMGYVVDISQVEPLMIKILPNRFGGAAAKASAHLQIVCEGLR